MVLPYLDSVIGVVLIKGGNHKLCVELEGYPPESKECVAKDIRDFQRLYAHPPPHPLWEPTLTAIGPPPSPTMGAHPHRHRVPPD